MKKWIAWTLVLALLLCGCGGKTADDAGNASAKGEPVIQETAVPETEAVPIETTEETTVPTEPEIFRNPLNGEILDAPFTGRVYASTISNLQENLPHVGVNHADVVMEMYVNMNNVVRCLALFTDIESVDAVGSTRSTRPIFNDIAQHYDLVLSHAGGSSTALNDAANRGIDNFNVDSWEVAQTGASYRDTVYKRSYENSLFMVGPAFRDYAESKGVAMELEKDYGFRFGEEGTPANGESADSISWTMVYGQAKKNTSFVYNAEMDKYVWNQYGKEMKDQITDELEAFTNVIVMFAKNTNEGIYHIAELDGSGEGYFACGGKIVPIRWVHEKQTDAFTFFLADGTPLQQGVGSTYIAIAPIGSAVKY